MKNPFVQLLIAVIIMGLLTLWLGFINATMVLFAFAVICFVGGFIMVLADMVKHNRIDTRNGYRPHTDIHSEQEEA